MDQDPADKVANTILRLIKDIFATVVCLGTFALLLIIVGLGLLALPVFLGCWLLVRLIYWLFTRLPMWLDADRINTGRIHRWPYIVNFLICLTILVGSWFSLRAVADELVRAYLCFLWDHTPKWIQGWFSGGGE